jgi:hypothetical protein
MADAPPPVDSSELPRIGFRDSELDLCGTFLDIAAVDADDPSAALTARSKAQQGYNVALSWIASIRDRKERDRLMSRLLDLRKRLDELDMI